MGFVIKSPFHIMNNSTFISGIFQNFLSHDNLSKGSKICSFSKIFDFETNVFYDFLE